MSIENITMLAGYSYRASNNTTYSSTGNHTNATGETVSIDNLLPAIFQCFAIILAGYIAGCAGLISQAQGKGIEIFVGKFCLPALLFKNMVELDFSQVNWIFLLGLTISKSAVFLAVAVLTILLKRPMHLGLAGIFAIFATQSNDFALGYPILKALYSDSNPEYLQYIYLVAPISLVLLNPIGFTMLEIHRQNNDMANNRGTCRVLLHVIKDVITNPIVFMVIIGIVGNVMFNKKVPIVLDDILDVLGNAFSASALFYLGLNLVGKVEGQLGIQLIVPLLLIGVKTLLLPLITWQVTGALELGQMSVNSSRSLSMYAFLYGTFPTAPSVFLYASQFSIAQDIIATGMVACTFLSAPLMYVSAKMMTLVVVSEMDYKSLLMETSFDLSVISLAVNVWILAVLVLSRKYTRMPHHFLICLIFSQSLACVGMIIYDGLDTNMAWHHYLQFVILLVGIFSTRCFAAVLAVVLYLLHCKSLCFVLRVKAWLYFFGLGFPIVCTGLLMVFGNHHLHNEIDPSFHYGKDQAILSLIILVICSLITITFLVLRQRNTASHKDKQSFKARSRSQQHEDKYSFPGNMNSNTDEDNSVTERLIPAAEALDDSLKRSEITSRTKLLVGQDDDYSRYRSISCSNCTEDCQVIVDSNPTVTDCVSNIEDIVPLPRKMRSLKSKYNKRTVSSQCAISNDCYKDTVPTESVASSTSSDSLMNDTVQNYKCMNGVCNYQEQRKCAGLVRCYRASNLSSNDIQDKEGDDVEIKKPKMKDEYETDKFVILLLVLQISMFVGLFLCTWRLFNDSKSGIYVEIEFLDSFFNYGQSLVVLAVFGFDTQLMILPCLKRWRKWMYGIEIVHIPALSDMTEHNKQMCQQFIKYHKQKCEDSIVRDMKYRLRTYHSVFCGTAFCDWLIEVGLCDNRSEAVDYGRQLLRGRVIYHITMEHNFHDMPYFYRFMDNDDRNEIEER